MPPGLTAQVPPSSEEAAVLARGEISDDRMSGGVALSLLGFGIGQAAQGRWSDTGWKLALAEGGGLIGLGGGFALIFAGWASSESSPNLSSLGSVAGVELVALSAITIVGAHFAGIYDAATGPRDHNARVRALRERYGMASIPRTQFAPYAVPARGGGVAGLAIRF